MVPSKASVGDLQTDAEINLQIPAEPVVPVILHGAPPILTTAPATSAPPSYSELKLNCERAAALGKIKSKSLSISFPNPGKVCDWQTNGNLSQENDYIRARREQYQDISLNIGEKVCGLSMVNKIEQNFYYDDNIFITMNNFVLSSTSTFSDHLESQNNFYKYDWSRLINKKAQNLPQDTVASKQYCAGRAQGLASCSFPETESYGKVNLAFKDEVIQKILTMTTVDKIRLGVITTGDNNSTDCQHVPLDFEIAVLYYE